MRIGYVQYKTWIVVKLATYFDNTCNVYEMSSVINR